MIFLAIILIVVATFSFILFGITGLKVVIGILFVSIPFYLMLNNFGLGESEKYVFSVLLGITIFPSLVYLLGLVVSFRISILAVFLFLMVLAFVLRKYKLKKSN